MSEVINYQFRLNVVLIFKIEFLIYYYVLYTNQCFMLYKVILAVVDCDPQTQQLRYVSLLFHASWLASNSEAGGMSAYYFMQVGGATNSEAGGKSAYNNVQVGETDHNIVKSDFQFLQTLQVGGATNTEAGGKSASMNIIKKLGNKMLPNFIFKIINPI
ncbi:TPA: hypothetical protein PF660_001754 [Staphylococcus aureus]|nr:hypothetical protein [Staphylococcus aureus]HDG6067129.1 hypothetical protein [Staphylococcus aureus]